LYFRQNVLHLLKEGILKSKKSIAPKYQRFFFILNLFHLMKQRMHHAAESLRLSAENMANLHTPGYKARHLSAPHVSKKGTFDGHLRVTHEKHLKSHTHGVTGKITEDRSNPETFTGNTVSYAHELQKANTAGNTHKQMHTLWQTHLHMLDLALKR